jgi:hypothetical protein
MPDVSRSPLAAAVALGLGLVVGGCSSSTTTTTGEDAATHKDGAREDSMPMPAYGVATDAMPKAHDAAKAHDAGQDVNMIAAYGVAMDAMPMPAYGVATDAMPHAKDAAKKDAKAHDAGTDTMGAPAYGAPSEDAWASRPGDMSELGA